MGRAQRRHLTLAAQGPWPGLEASPKKAGWFPKGGRAEFTGKQPTCLLLLSHCTFLSACLGDPNTHQVLDRPV